MFAHEFGGDHRSWEPQLRHFARRYRVHAARGFPPSDVPDSPEHYERHRATDDLISVFDTAGIDQVRIRPHARSSRPKTPADMPSTCGFRPNTIRPGPH